MTVAQSMVPIAYILVGPLADNVFEPLMADSGRLATSFGELIGTGPGRGYALFFSVLGVVVVGMSILAWFYCAASQRRVGHPRCRDRHRRRRSRRQRTDGGTGSVDRSRGGRRPAPGGVIASLDAEGLPEAAASIAAETGKRLVTDVSIHAHLPRHLIPSWRCVTSRVISPSSPSSPKRAACATRARARPITFSKKVFVPTNHAVPRHLHVLHVRQAARRRRRVPHPGRRGGDRPCRGGTWLHRGAVHPRRPTRGAMGCRPRIPRRSRVTRTTLEYVQAMTERVVEETNGVTSCQPRADGTRRRSERCGPPTPRWG